jgi:hypothetical protein
MSCSAGLPVGRCVGYVEVNCAAGIRVFRGLRHRWALAEIACGLERQHVVLHRAPADVCGVIHSVLGGLTKRFVTRALIVVAATLGIVFVQIAPASATVHEIVAQWCSGHDPLGPPGISDDTKRNFAQPLNASGFIGDPVPFTGSDGPGLLITFNYGNPNVKVVGTGVFVNINQPGQQPLYIELIEPNPDFPAFKRCPKLANPV